MNNPIAFSLADIEFKRLNEAYPNMRNNQDIGNYGEHVVKLYLESIGATNVLIGGKKIDIQANINGKNTKYEVKSTTKSDITFNNLKVSSPKDYELIKAGMEIIRVCKIGQQTLDLYFLKFGRDFTLKEEPRWRLSKIK
ncbi:hypothetical protein GZ212_13085 [Mangrovimonas sp. CR14]|uniref:hypothetical protein n=1 Tax=Mangrovimonas sp. CR14 TaxID=2706120 RepID=UPI00141E63D9|nr:hypothetical protein [Mangrovimonas sp. CR14]NIK93091.1 hypothetical protein [Mangrovimonas sp. CR14]